MHGVRLATVSLPIGHNCPIIPRERLANDSLGGELVDFLLCGLQAEHGVETVVDCLALLEGGHLDRGFVELPEDAVLAQRLLVAGEGPEAAEHADATVDNASRLHANTVINIFLGQPNIRRRPTAFNKAMGL